MKKPVRILILISTAFILISFYVNAGNPDAYELSQKSPQVSDNQAGWTDREWRAFDVNGDKRFDKLDIEKLLADGWQDFKHDLNGDGAKDAIDVLCLYLKLSILDRNCNEEVTDDDFAPVSPVSLPAADKDAVQKLVDEIVEETRTSLPADVEDKLFGTLPDSLVLTLPERAYVFRLAGISALLQKNLEAAKWAFGRACQTDDRSASSFGSLAFTLAVDKRHEDALALLALAMELFPESGATMTTIAWIFARHDQKNEAIKYYRLAALYAPDISQYNMNLGIACMRSGQIEEAHDEFQDAFEKDPVDFKATIYSSITNPSFRSGGVPSAKLNEFKREYLEYLRMNQETDPSGDYMSHSWEGLSQCEQSNKIVEFLDNRYTKRFSEKKQLLEDELTNTVKNVMQAYLPRWKNAANDMKLYNEGCEIIYKTEYESKAELENEAGKIHTKLRHEQGKELLSYSQFFLESALKQAETDGSQRFNKTYSVIKKVPVPSKVISEMKTEAYQDALEEAVRDCYESHILSGINLLRFERKTETLSGYSSETTYYAAVPMAIINGCMTIPGYCDGDIQTGPAFSVGFTVGLDLWIFSFEWNTTTGEVEFNIGQGVIFGGTWSPESGFGFQFGLGVDVSLGPVKFSGKTYIKVSDKIELKGEFGVFTALSGTSAVLGDKIQFQAVVQEP